MKKMKKLLSLFLTVIFVMSLSASAFANEIKSTEQLSSSEYSSEIKSAEQSVLDYFAAVQNKDYGTLSKISVNKWMSEDVLRNTIEIQHEEGLIAEKLTILSSEKRGENTVMVTVSYFFAGEERVKTYPVVLVNNKWIVNIADAIGSSEEVVFWDGIVPATDDSTTDAKKPVSYSGTLSRGLNYYWSFSISNADLQATILGSQKNTNKQNVTYGICWLNALGDWVEHGSPISYAVKGDSSYIYKQFKKLKGRNIVLALEVWAYTGGTSVSGTISDE